jgi:hypothetical protein
MLLSSTTAGAGAAAFASVGFKVMNAAKEATAASASTGTISRCLKGFFAPATVGVFGFKLIIFNSPFFI